MTNTPTTRTDNHARVYEAAGMPAAYTVMLSHARQLERELTESQSWVRASMESAAIASSTIAGLKRELAQARVFLEVSTANTEAAQNSYHAEVKQRMSAEAERDNLRKMIDAFAECVGDGDEWLMADYRDLPHVRERKTK